MAAAGGDVDIDVDRDVWNGRIAIAFVAVRRELPSDATSEPLYVREITEGKERRKEEEEEEEEEGEEEGKLKKREAQKKKKKKERGRKEDRKRR